MLKIKGYISFFQYLCHYKALSEMFIINKHKNNVMKKLIILAMTAIFTLSMSAQCPKKEGCCKKQTTECYQKSKDKKCKKCKKAKKQKKECKKCSKAQKCKKGAEQKKCCSKTN